MFEKLMTRLAFILFGIMIFMALTNTAKADDLFIYYNSNDTGAEYSRLKSHYEGLGFTVTGSTSTTVNSSDISGKDLVIDIAGTSNCGSTCRTNYDSYVSAGGKLIIAAPAGASNRQSNIESLIENKMSVGTMTYYTGTCSTDLCWQSYKRSGYTTTGVTDYLPGAGQLFSATGGTAMASNTASSSWHTWYKWDYGSNGGTIIVAMGYDQFQTNLSYTSSMTSFLTEIAEDEGLYSSTPQAAITTSQQTTVNTARNKTQAGNKIYMTQSGSGIDLDIMQDGDDNLITGTDLTSAANITGDSISLSITQKNTDNVLGIDINGNSNDVDIWQDTSQRAIVGITGASNTVALMQLHLSGSGAHHSSINVAGNSNSVTIDQKETGDKILFLDIDSSNTVDIDQLGTGEHFLDVTLTDNHTVTVTQDGSGTHNGYLDLSGNPTTMNLTQDSSTDQNYYLQQSCATTTCSVSVTQN
jgi:hypothetical protein